MRLISDPIYDLLCKARKKNRHAFSILDKGLKPSLFLTIDYDQKLLKDSLPLVIYEESSNIVFFFEYWQKNQVNLMILNKESLEKVIPVLNSLQVTYQIKSSIDLINEQIKFYRVRQIDKEKRFDFTILTGIMLGYPVENVLNFAEEISSGRFRPDRKAYSSKKSDCITFIGYSETKDVSERLIKLWDEI